MMPDKIRASFPMIKALNEISARNPMASGKSAAAFNLNNRRSGSKYFLLFLLPLRAERMRGEEKLITVTTPDQKKKQINASKKTNKNCDAHALRNEFKV